MKPRKLAIAVVMLTVPAALAVVGSTASAAPRGQAAQGDERFMAVAASDTDYAGLKADVQKAGGRIVREMPEIGTVVVRAPRSAKSKMAASQHSAGVMTDHVESLAPVENASAKSPQRQVTKVDVGKVGPPVTPDPAYFAPGLLWNQQRVRMTEAFRATTGDPAVTVGVADTGLDFTHAELAPRITQVVDFTANENPPLCKTFFGVSDAELAAEFGGPATTDWHGHGSWIGGNIAAALDGQGVNGIAPNVGLVSLKISGWCGSAYDSTILDAFLFAANNGIDVVSISFGGYLDRSDPDQDLIYKQYVAAVRYAKRFGTTIVAAAGNEHVRVGAGGKVLSHGQLSTPGAPATDFPDLFGMYEVPGGIPGVVDVASTGNVVNAASVSCPVETGNNRTCKPTTDVHQPIGAGLQDQLAYYSNYGPRIDVAAPGGARKFNLPVWDRGGTPGFPVTVADGTAAWEDFSTTSNWATGIPCFVFTGGGFPPDQCYSTIQGTSMATPHVSAAIALIASASPQLRHRPEALVNRLLNRARDVHGNTTPPASATDMSPGDLTGVACATGYCHLGGPAISDNEAYGAGIVDAAAAVGVR